MLSESNSKMPSYGHIGIIACSAPGAALCYETICTEAGSQMGRFAHPEISLHGYSFAEHVRLMELADWPAVSALLLNSAKKLALLGADFLICPDNTAHHAFANTTPKFPIPLVHIADTVIAEAKVRQFSRLGILGTRFLMEGQVYSQRLQASGLDWRLPEPEDRGVVNSIIFDDLTCGRVPVAAKNELVRIIQWLRDIGNCDCVVLGCTELPLVVTDEISPLPTLDSTRLLARAAINLAVSMRKHERV